MACRCARVLLHCAALCVLCQAVAGGAAAVDGGAGGTIKLIAQQRLLLQSANSSTAKATAGAVVAPMLRSVVTFWLRHGLDRESGGFHGTLDQQGTPTAPTSKTIVQQARHLWTFSALLMAQPAAKGFDAAAVRAAADTAHSFMVKHMVKRDTGAGSAFVYEVSRDGSSVLQRATSIYGNAFAIYGLAAYARATGSREALALALEVFRTLDTLYHSRQHRGYDETPTGFTFDSVELPAAAGGGSGGGSAAVVTEAGQQRPRRLLSQSFNTLLHLAEALTELSAATGGSEPDVTARLLELVRLQAGPLVVRRSGAGTAAAGGTPAAFITSNYDPRTWQPVPGSTPNYGHNIEAAWLLADAVAELRARGAVDSAEAERMLGVLQEVGAAAVAAGYDTTHGGWLDSPANTQVKVWWGQVEGALGLEWLARRTGSSSYRDKLQQTLAFTAAQLWDRQLGELFWQVARAGGPPLAFNAGGQDFPATTKGSHWKASYHTGRALLRLQQAGVL